MWEDAVASEAFQAGDRRRDRVPARDRAAVRDAGGGDRKHAAGRRRGGSEARATRDHDLPAARRDRGRRRALSPARRPTTTRCSRSSPSATASGCSRATDARSTSRSRRCCCDGHETIGLAESCTGGLLAARLTERPGSSEYVIGGAVVYSNEAKSELVGVDPGADRSARGRVGRGGAGACRRRRGALRHLGGGRHHRRRRAGRRDAGEAGGTRLLLGRRTGGPVRLRRGAVPDAALANCRATGPPCASARPRSRCI